MKKILFILTFILLPKTFANSWTCQYLLTDNITGYSTYHPTTIQACSQIEAANIAYNKWCSLAWPVNRTCSVPYSSCQQASFSSNCKSHFGQQTKGNIQRLLLSESATGRSDNEATQFAVMKIQLKVSTYTRNCKSNLKGQASFTTTMAYCLPFASQASCTIDGIFICAR